MKRVHVYTCTTDHKFHDVRGRPCNFRCGLLPHVARATIQTASTIASLIHSVCVGVISAIENTLSVGSVSTIYGLNVCMLTQLHN